MVTMFDGTTVFKIASACVVVGVILGVYLSYKTRKFFRKH
jgi:uncharacterized protein YneF (UPF0154 family)